MRDLPKAWTEGIISEPVDDELVVYDAATRMGHRWTPGAASVWALCDGRRSHAEIAQQLVLEATAVDQAVNELADCGLLEDGPDVQPVFSRRDATIGLAKAAGGGLLVYSVAIPSAAQAASGASPNGTPQTPTQCTAAGGAKATDANCASRTCYQDGAGQNTRFCVSATCRVGGAPCTTFSDCCAGQSADPRHTQVCLFGTCLA